MRLYLSSFRMGDHAEHLAALADEDSRSMAVIANAMDALPLVQRRECSLRISPGLRLR